MAQYFNPATIAFNYQKNSGIIPNMPVQVDFSFTSGGLDIDNLTIEKPNWLDFVFQSYDDQSTPPIANYIASINSQFANQLSNGYHQEEIKLDQTVNVNNPFGGIISYGNSIKTTANIQVSEYTPLQISPSQFTFNKVVGDANPPASYISIQAQNNWSIIGDQPWISFSNQNGNGNGTVAMNIDISGLGVGYYHGTFLVDDGNSTRTGHVYLYMTGNGQEEEYIIATPEVLQYSAEYQTNPNTVKQVVIDSTQPVVATTNVTWLQLQQSNLPAGSNILQVKIINTAILDIGTYPAQITLNTSLGVTLVNVILVIVEKNTSGLRNGGFYFADARNRLNLTNGNENAEAVLKFNTEATLEQKQYERKVPYYRNSLSVIIGLETNILLRPNPILDIFYTHFYIPLRPIKIALAVYDKTIGATQLEERVSYGSMEFINGDLPENVLLDYFNLQEITKVLFTDLTPGSTKLAKRLTHLPKKMTLAKDAVISFAQLYQEALTICGLNIFDPSVVSPSIGLSPEFTNTIPINVDNTNLYAAEIRLSDYNVGPGFKIYLKCGIIESDITIKDTDLPTVQIVWRNQWDMQEIFNCNGEVEIEVEDETETITLSNDGKEYTKAIETKTPKSFNINTGLIYSEEEVAHLASITEAKQVWLHIGDNRYEVTKKFRNIKTHQTRRFVREFNLKFESAVK